MRKPSLKVRLQEILTELQTPHPTPEWSNVTDEFWPVHQVGFAEERLRMIVFELELKEKHRKLSAEKRLKERIAKRKKALAMKYRGNVCAGCHYNRYNYETAGDTWNAATTGEGCWFLPIIKNRKCRQYHV